VTVALLRLVGCVAFEGALPGVLIAMGGGIVLALLLAGTLMCLAFVSNRSGHDEAVSETELPARDE